MAEIDVVLAVMASTTTLYGFSIAYYAFARSLQHEEEVRVWDSERSPQVWTTREETRAHLQGIWKRRLRLNAFLIVATFVFAISLLLIVPYTVGQLGAGPVQDAVLSFGALAAAVVLFLLYVAVDNGLSTLREICSPTSLESLNAWQELTFQSLAKDGRPALEIAKEIGRSVNEVRERLGPKEERAGPRDPT